MSALALLALVARLGGCVGLPVSASQGPHTVAAAAYAGVGLDSLCASYSHDTLHTLISLGMARTVNFLPVRLPYW